MLVDKLLGDDPRRGADDLVDPLAVAHALFTLVLRHDGAALVAVCVFVGAHADDERHVRERLLGLLQRARVAEMEQVVDAVRVDAHRPVRRRRRAARRQHHRHDFLVDGQPVVVVRDRRRLCSVRQRCHRGIRAVNAGQGADS